MKPTPATRREIADKIRRSPSNKTVMRTIQCPKCLAYTQGDYPHMAALPIHFEAVNPDTEMDMAESLDQPGVCAASGQLVHTFASEKEDF